MVINRLKTTNLYKSSETQKYINKYSIGKYLLKSLNTAFTTKDKFYKFK